MSRMKFFGNIFIKYVLIHFLILCCNSVYSQQVTDNRVFNRELSGLSVSSPDVWSFHKYIMNPIGLYRGTPDVSIPLYMLKDGQIEIPIVLRYNTSGIKVEEEASWVGLGWNLNLGGFVTRVVVDGFDDDDDTFETYSSLFLKPSIYEEHRYKDIPVTTAVYDSIPHRTAAVSSAYWGKLTPDAYLFSYPGNSGCYVKDYRDDSIVVIRRDQNVRINEFNANNFISKTIEIRTPEGIRHLFSYGAHSRIQGNNRPNSITYPLDETEYPGGAKIIYHYYTYPYLKVDNSMYCNGTIKDSYGTAGQFFKDRDVKTSLAVIEQRDIQLKDIETPNYKIEFATSPRMDIDSIPKLDYIIIKDAHSNSVLKKFKLNYSYFEPKQGITHDTKSLRLQLQSVCEVAVDGNTEINHYYFQYNSTPLPPKDSYTTDHWGYANSSDYIAKGSRLPDLRGLINSELSDNDKRYVYNYPNKYDKGHDYSFCQAGLLRNIIYPTGGRTEFEYESNSFRGFPIRDNNGGYQVDTVSFTIIDQNSPTDTRSFSVTTNGPRVFHVQYYMQRGNNSWSDVNGSSITIPYSSNGGTQTLYTVWESGQNQDTVIQGELTVTRPAGFHVFMVTFPDELGNQSGPFADHGCLWAKIWYEDQEPETPESWPTVSYGCGMRVKAIKHFDAGGTTAKMAYNYSYVDPVTGLSSGKLYDRPYYWRIFENCQYPTIYSNPPSSYPVTLFAKQFEVFDTPLSYNPYGLDSGVGYSYVTETISGVQGKTVYRFSNEDAHYHPFSYEISDWQNGHILDKTIYNSTGSELRKESYVYSILVSRFLTGVSLFINNLRFPNLLYPEIMSGEHLSLLDTDPYYSGFFKVIQYGLNQIDVTLKKKSIVEDGVETIIDYTYNPSTLLLEKEVIHGSGGEITEVYYTHPGDYLSNPSLNYMVNTLHRIAPIVEKKVFRDSVFVFSSLNGYNNLGWKKSIRYSDVFSSPYYPVCNWECLSFDDFGNPVAVRYGESDVVLYLWGFGGRYPVAEIRGLSSSQIDALMEDALEFSLSDIPDYSWIASIKNAHPYALVKEFHYDLLGNVTEIKDPRNCFYGFGYDSFGRLIRETDCNSNKKRQYSYHEFVSTSDKNYVETQVFTVASASDSIRTRVFYDGLGRRSTILKVSAAPGVSNADIVSSDEYDSKGRLSTSYLPIPINGNNGAYVSPASVYSAGQTYYNDPRPYQLMTYESAPSERVSSITGPGASWHYQGKSFKKEYLANHVSSSLLRCHRFTVENSTGAGSVIIRRIGNFAPSELNLTVTTDEDGRKKYTFVDKTGRTVLERLLISNSSFADTYYVYDRYGHLAAVLPPELSDRLIAESSTSFVCDSTSSIQQLAFLYRYDGRGRLRGRKLPGAGWEYFIYDKRDRLVFSQDSLQRTRGEWAFYLGDFAGRECLAGVCANSFDPMSNDPLPNSVGVSFSAGNSLNYGYYVNGIVLVSPQFLTVRWYDSYDFYGKWGCPVPGSGKIEPEITYSSDGIQPASSLGAKGLMTGSLNRVLSPGNENVYLWSSYYYDDYGRMNQTKSSTHVGGVEKRFYAYDFTDNVILEIIEHEDSSGAKIIERIGKTYDSWGRIQTVTHRLNNLSPVTLHDYEYDSIGRMTSDARNGATSLETSIGYNIRSWITSIDSDVFSETLYYNIKRASSSISQMSGNISSVQWTCGNDNIPRYYDFTYDNLSRICSAYYGESGVQTGTYNRQYEYDKNGNLTRLITPSYVLATSYEGNHLLDYYNTGPDPANPISPSYHNVCGYDANGNMYSDSASSIVSISYNHIKKPSLIVRSQGYSPQSASCVKYLYSHSGEKLRRIDSEYTPRMTDTLNVKTDYVGNLIFKNDVLKTLFFDGGYIEYVSGVPVYRFFVKDHQGNNRIVADRYGNIVQVNHYDPYGQSLDVIVPPEISSFKYSGKEFDESISAYDFGARHYSTDFPRWRTIDPKAEKYFSVSPYAYCAGNPINMIDPQGDTVLFAPGSSAVFKRRVHEASKYMRSHGTDKYLRQLQESPYYYCIEEGDAPGFIYSTTKPSTIYWNPYLVMEDDESYMWVSPVTQLSHEFGHATDFDDEMKTGSVQEYVARNKTSDPRYSNANEKRVIETVEQEVAIAHGEIPEGQVTRTKHINSSGHSYTFTDFSLREIIEIVKEHNWMLYDDTP